MEQDAAFQRVLVVDDDPGIADVTKRALSRAGFDVDYAQGPFEVAGAIRRLSPQLVVLDLNMPGLDGVQLSTFIKDIPLVLFSAATHRVPAEAQHRFLSIVAKQKGAGELAKTLLRLRRSAEAAGV